MKMQLLEDMSVDEDFVDEVIELREWDYLNKDHE